MKDKVRVNVTISKGVLEQFRKLVPNISASLENLMRKELLVLQGGPPTENLADRLENVEAETDDLTKKISKRMGQLQCSEPELFQRACDMFREFGLKTDYSNVDVLIPQFMDAWHGSESFMHSFISLLQMKYNEKKLLQSLTQLRHLSFGQPERLMVKEDSKEEPSDVSCAITAIVPLEVWQTVKDLGLP